MLHFKYDEWHRVEKSISFPISSKEQVAVSVSCSQPVELRAGRDGEKPTTIFTGNSFNFKAVLYGYDYIELATSSKTPFGIKTKLKPRQIGEPINDDRPPVIPMPTASDNLVLQLQAAVQRQTRDHKKRILEPDADAPSLYSYEFDDEPLFEEEEALAREAARKQSNPAPAKPTDEAKPKAEPKLPEPAPASPAPPEPDPDAVLNQS